MTKMLLLPPPQQSQWWRKQLLVCDQPRSVVRLGAFWIGVSAWLVVLLSWVHNSCVTRRHDVGGVNGPRSIQYKHHTGTTTTAWNRSSSPLPLPSSSTPLNTTVRLLIPRHNNNNKTESSSSSSPPPQFKELTHFLARKKNVAAHPSSRLGNSGNNSSNSSSSSSYNPFDTCKPTTRVELILPSLSESLNDRNSASKWRLQSLDAMGLRKTVAGDEFYVTYHRPSIQSTATRTNTTGTAAIAPTAVAIVTDLLDGTYELDFVSPPTINNNQNNDTTNDTTTQPLRETAGDTAAGTLTISFVYTCHIGQAYQPIKDAWPNGGGTRTTHSILLRHPLTHAPLPPPHSRPFVRPPPLRAATVTSTNARADSDGNDNHDDDVVLLNEFDTLIAVGDSLMGQFVEAYRHVTPNPLVIYQANIWKYLTVSTLAYWLDRIDEWHGKQLRPTATANQNGATSSSSPSTPSVALILGSSSWDILHSENVQPVPGSLFTDHLTAVRGLIQAVRERYPTVSLFWKSPSALHLHMARPECWGSNKGCANITRYLSHSRAFYLHTQQSLLMRELGVPLLDIFEATYLSAHEHKTGDAVHYDYAFSTHLFSWFFTPLKRRKRSLPAASRVASASTGKP